MARAPFDASDRLSDLDATCGRGTREQRLKILPSAADKGNVSTHVPSGVISLADSRTRVMALAQGFDRDPNQCRAHLQDLLETDSDGFYAGALDVLASGDDSRGGQYVTGLLAGSDLLLRALCDRRLTAPQAANLARAAVRLNPMIDIALARKLVTLGRELAEDAASGESDLQVGNVGRVMEVVSEICHGPRLMTSLTRLLQHSNSHVRSKAVKLVGRVGGADLKWVRSRLGEPDPRIRANAVESLWGIDSGEVRELLGLAARDANNRVAGNALLALYRLGDSSVIPRLLKMTEHESPLFRATAAWVMGEAGDPRFTETLVRLLREPNAPVRARAMSSLGCIKAAVTRSRETPRGLATAMWLPGEKDRRRLQVAVISPDRGHPPRILPTQFVLTEENRHVISYEVAERPPAGTMAVAFLFPSNAPADSPWIAGALRCRDWKLASDLWAIQPYTMEGAGRASGAGAALSHEGLSYSDDLDTINAALAGFPNLGGAPQFWQAVGLCGRPIGAARLAHWHLILFCPHDPEAAADATLVSSAQESSATLQVISAGPAPRVEEFCRAIRASFRVAEGPQQITEAIAMAYLNLMARYEIVYQPVVPDCLRLTIRVNAAGIAAETTLPAPLDAVAATPNPLPAAPGSVPADPSALSP